MAGLMMQSLRDKGCRMTLDEITYKIRGAVFEVNRVLGAGFLEKVYENALLSELDRRGLKADNQVPLKVYYKKEIVGEYFIDILVEDRVVLELKVVDSLKKIHQAQILNYLKATGVQVGFLVNFTYPMAEIKRIVYELPAGQDNFNPAKSAG
jgi:GxxExxY protein